MVILADRLREDMCPGGLFDGNLEHSWILDYFRTTSPESHSNSTGQHGLDQTVRSQLDLFFTEIRELDLQSDDIVFSTYYSIGFTACKHEVGDSVFALDGTPELFLLRLVEPPHTYGFVGTCYLWAAFDLDYWNLGSHNGRWPARPRDFGCEQVQRIVVY
ncbi:hypothetical protein EK21DRAFT_116876 [Setomelanomma holmii]|uniref:Uncharacterized protein n=1 Tax=Setomelanomma holmii TaxID=210430 RepID=A0A9P4H170_9PLEO|nr:hypothetical protein EK21DRAFT_116876 [Setomelanomma holmii]